jgi:hypothetical protein
MIAHAVMRGSSMTPLLQDGMLLQLGMPPRLARGQIAVFKAGERLVAHRVVRARGSTIVCCGDAQPDRMDFVDIADVVGVVRAVYRSDGRRVRRIDNVLFRACGVSLAYLQPVRALVRRTAPQRRERTYRLLVQAASAIVRGDSEALLQAVEQAAPQRLAETAKRHRMGAVLCSALEPLRANPYARAACELTRRVVWTNAAYMRCYRAQVVDVVRQLRAAGVPVILLKGAARAFRREPQWLLHDSADIDVLVDGADVERAEQVLRDAGYASRCSQAARESYRRRHHHTAPLYPPQRGVCVEVHYASHWSMRDSTTFADLLPYTITIRDGGIDALVFDRAGTALHYTIHAIDRPALRDVFLLAETLGAMNALERGIFENALERTRCTARTAQAALLLACEMAGIDRRADPRTRRFATWMQQREDLPVVFRARPECVDAWFAADGGTLAAVLRTALERRTPQSALARLASAAGIALYLPFMR